MKSFLSLMILTFAIFACNVQKKNSNNSTEIQNIDSDLNPNLKGKWVLNYMAPVNGKESKELFQIQKPYLNFVDNQKVAGNNGCNNIAGTYKAESNRIQFLTDKFISTKMFCEGVDESIFLNQLKKINRFSISNNSEKLILMSGDIVMMDFKRSEN